MPMKEAMILAGYSESYAGNSHQLTRSKGWLEITRDVLGFDDGEILKIHLALLSAIKFDKTFFPINCDDTEIKEIIENTTNQKLIRIERTTKSKIAFFTRPDYPTIVNALDKAYRLKGYYPFQSRSHVAATENAGIKELLDQLEKDGGVECKPKPESTTPIPQNNHYITPEERALYEKYGLLDGVS